MVVKMKRTKWWKLKKKQEHIQRKKLAEDLGLGLTEEFKVELGLLQASALSYFMFTMVTDRLTDRNLCGL